MRPSLRWPCLAFTALLAVVAFQPVVAAQASDPSRDRSCGWVLEPSADRENVLFPDLATRYLGAAIPVPLGGSIELKGKFPHARYMSLQTYSTTLQTATNLRDDQIDPDPGSTNPFRVGADRNATQRDYTVRIVAGKPPASPPANTLYNTSPDGTRSGNGFAYRIYLPDKGTGAFGGVPAPSITLVLATGQRIPLPTCPDPLPDLMPVTNLLGSLGLPDVGLDTLGLGLLAPQRPTFRRYINAGQVYATDVTENKYTSDTLTPLIASLTAQLPSGLGENVDNKYVYAYLSSEYGRVLMLRGKMPTTPRTYDGDATVPPPAEMRYWSMCTADRTTQTYACVHDQTVQVDAGGYFTIAISTAADRPANATDACGVSWLPWGLDPKGIAYMRNMLPGPTSPMRCRTPPTGPRSRCWATTTRRAPTTRPRRRSSRPSAATDPLGRRACRDAATYPLPVILSRTEWSERAHAHAERVDVWIQPHLARRLRGEKHPVHDFLFTYYSQRPAALRRWHPGYGVQLAEAPEYAGLKGYDDGTVSAAYLDSQRPVIARIRTLLAATLSRPANLGCFGLHEWAMVYRGNPATSGAENAMRHDWPLRLGGSGTDQVVENHRIGCSHFDAFRFFTAPARPLNTLHPGRDDRADFEQPGCLHAGMDLYKHAFRLTPLIPSELVADAFALAWDIRILDMRAAPYDFTGVRLDPTGEPWTPVPIETAEGKATYAAAQRAFAERGAPIRELLVVACDRLLAQPPRPETDGEQAHAET